MRAPFCVSHQKVELGGLALIFLLEQRELEKILSLPIGMEKGDVTLKNSVFATPK